MDLSPRVAGYSMFGGLPSATGTHESKKTRKTGFEMEFLWRTILLTTMVIMVWAQVKNDTQSIPEGKQNPALAIILADSMMKNTADINVEKPKIEDKNAAIGTAPMVDWQ
uniref:Uncharacterized protein n=1 Tax=Glossina austeni TaxID=7395 RepID=A0A1A9UJC1_GLOAU